MNISGDSDLGRFKALVNRAGATDPAQFTQILNNAAVQMRMSVPAASEAGQLSLSKKKEKDSIYRVNEVEEMSDDTDAPESVEKVVQNIVNHLKLISAIERRSAGL